MYFSSFSSQSCKCASKKLKWRHKFCRNVPLSNILDLRLWTESVSSELFYQQNPWNCLSIIHQISVILVKWTLFYFYFFFNIVWKIFDTFQLILYIYMK